MTWDKNGWTWVYMGQDLPGGHWLGVVKDDQNNYSVRYTPPKGNPICLTDDQGDNKTWKSLSSAKRNAQKWLKELVGDKPSESNITRTIRAIKKELNEIDNNKNENPMYNIEIIRHRRAAAKNTLQWVLEMLSGEYDPDLYA